MNELRLGQDGGPGCAQRKVFEITDQPENADLILFNTLLRARKGDKNVSRSARR